MHIPKTGGQSMLPVWYRHRIPVIGHDIRQPDYVSLARYKADMDPDCFAFAFVRNPWDRLVSTFFYLKKGGDNEDDRKDAEKYLPYEDFRTFVLEAFRGREIFEQLHLRPQYTWLSDGDRLVVDSVGRFEDLQAHFGGYCRMFGLPNYRLPHVNKSSHADFRSYYDAQTWAIVREAYREDVELFGYDAAFPGDSG